jgi:hypothetical protein
LIRSEFTKNSNECSAVNASWAKISIKVYLFTEKWRRIRVFETPYAPKYPLASLPKNSKIGILIENTTAQFERVSLLNFKNGL